MTVVSIEFRARRDAVARLAERVRSDLAYLDYPIEREWTMRHRRDGREAIDVLIVGGGQSGLVTAFALKRERVGNFLIVDRNPRGAEGPWRSYARMENLRTPKAVTGPDLGVPSLTPRAWYEARFGIEAWNNIATVPRAAWNEYLDWYRDTLGLTVRNDVSVERIEPSGNLLAVHASGPAGNETIIARKIVFATGLEGSGVWRVPTIVSANLPRGKYAHAAEPIEFAALHGQRVAVIGAGASAFDNAAVALETGAARVDLFARRPFLSPFNPLYWMSFTGALAHFYDLPDLHRWRFSRQLEKVGTPPPPSAVARCKRFANFAQHLGEPWLDVNDRDHGFTAVTTSGRHEFDFVIVATAASHNPRLRPEFAGFADAIALWEDRFIPPTGEESETLGRYPYLGSAFEFTEREPGTAPWLRHIHNPSFSGVASMGNVGGAPSLRFVVPRLVGGIVRDLFVNDADAYLADFLKFDTPEPLQAHW
jgi:FAD-dependent urate hydroxylase